MSIAKPMLDSAEERGREVNEEGLKSDIGNCTVQSKCVAVVTNRNVTFRVTEGISRNTVYFNLKLDVSNSQQNRHTYSKDV